MVSMAFGNDAYTNAHLGLPARLLGASNLQVLLVEGLIAVILVLTR